MSKAKEELINHIGGWETEDHKRIEHTNPVAYALYKEYLKMDMDIEKRAVKMLMIYEALKNHIPKDDKVLHSLLNRHKDEDLILKHGIENQIDLPF